MNTRLLYGFLGLLWICPSAMAANSPLPPVPQLGQEIQQFMDNSKGAEPSPEDQATMSAAATELAKAMPQPGLQVGAKAPDFHLTDPYGKDHSLYAALQNGPVVLTFYRGAWCPFCNLQLHALQASMPHIKAQGASLIAITPQQPDRSLAQLKKTPLDFAVLSDLNDEVMKAYRLYFVVPEKLRTLYVEKFKLDIEAYNGPGRYALPIPGTFIIDQSGIIRAAFADTDYKKRMEPAAIIAALQALKEK